MAKTLKGTHGKPIYDEFGRITGISGGPTFTTPRNAVDQTLSKRELAAGRLKPVLEVPTAFDMSRGKYQEPSQPSFMSPEQEMRAIQQDEAETRDQYNLANMYAGLEKPKNPFTQYAEILEMVFGKNNPQVNYFLENEIQDKRVEKNLLKTFETAQDVINSSDGSPESKAAVQSATGAVRSSTVGAVDYIQRMNAINQKTTERGVVMKHNTQTEKEKNQAFEKQLAKTQAEIDAIDKKIKTGVSDHEVAISLRENMKRLVNNGEYQKYKDQKKGYSKMAYDAGDPNKPFYVGDIINRVAEQLAPGDEQFKQVAHAIALTESGGRAGAEGDWNEARGMYESYGTFQNRIFGGRGAGAPGATPEEKARWLKDPENEVPFSLKSLYKVYAAGQAQALKAKHLAIFDSRHGQRPAAGLEVRAGDNYGRLVGQGSATKTIAEEVVRDPKPGVVQGASNQQIPLVPYIKPFEAPVFDAPELMKKRPPFKESNEFKQAQQGIQYSKQLADQRKQIEPPQWQQDAYNAAKPFLDKLPFSQTKGKQPFPTPAPSRGMASPVPSRNAPMVKQPANVPMKVTQYKAPAPTPTKAKVPAPVIRQAPPPQKQSTVQKVISNVQNFFQKKFGW